jgi:hypothetical protein
MKNRVFSIVLVLTIMFLLFPNQVIAATNPPGPDYEPPELIVTPGSQNIGIPPGGRAVWTVSLEGGTGG